MFVQEEKKLTTYLIESFVCLNACNEQNEKKKKKKKKILFFLHSSSLSLFYSLKYIKEKRRFKSIWIDLNR